MESKMDVKTRVQKLIDTFEDNLKNKIIPFWNNTVDHEHGGFYGYVGQDLKANKYYDKGSVKMARILWAYSAIANHYGNGLFINYAEIAYNYLVDCLYDQVHKGVFWKSSYDGNIINDTKHIYAQSFAIYGLCEYYQTTKHKDAINLALEIFDLIERKAYSKEKRGYYEQFSAGWEKQKNKLLANRFIVPTFTYNTILHLIEAYTSLYLSTEKEAVKNRLVNLLNIFYDQVYDENRNSCSVYFNKNWKSLLPRADYGHDIESCWLIDKTLEVIKIKDQRYRAMTENLAEMVFSYGYKDGVITRQKVFWKKSKFIIWWVQAESIIGFFNHFTKTDNLKYLNAVERIVDVTMDKIVDKRDGGEWFLSVDRNGNPQPGQGISENWKANYHNTRACLEIIKRGIQFLDISF